MQLRDGTYLAYVSLYVTLCVVCVHWMPHAVMLRPWANFQHHLVPFVMTMALMSARLPGFSPVRPLVIGAVVRPAL